MTKSQSDFNSVRSPSSLGMTTQMTKVSGSQSSLRSAISMKESPTTTREMSMERKEKYVERDIDVKSDKSSVITDKASVVSSTSTSASTAHKDFLTSSPTPYPRSSKHTKASRTILDNGIPQTEV